MIELYQFAPAWGLNLSPFCLKVETYCQLANISYKAKHTLPLRGPRGKLPYIIDRKSKVPDSGEIIEHLQMTYGVQLDSHLSQENRLVGHMTQQICEQSLYFAILYSRWIDERFWPEIKRAFFGALPPGARSLVPELARRGIRNSLNGQGYGLYQGERVYELAANDLAVIAQHLKRHDFAAGDQISSFDATLFAFLFNVVDVPLETPLKHAAATHPEIIDYLNRLKQALK